jgi:signal transduction histidine kinase/DNA-binding response OmpR family regulator
VKPPLSPIKSLRHKLFLGVLLSSIVALLLTCGALFAYDLHTYRKASAADLAVQAELIASASAAALQFDDAQAAAQNLGFLRARPAIRGAAIYTSQGKLFASYLRDGVQRSELPGNAGGFGVAVVGERISAFHPVVANGEHAGTVYLEADLDLDRRVASYLAIAFVVILLALGVAMLLSGWFQSGVTRPLIEMSRVAHDVVETRDYSLRAKPGSDDEVGTLAVAMNEMLEEIQHRTTALQRSAEEIGRLNEFLEQRVAERTAQLEDTNRKLAAASTAKSSFLSTMSHEIRTPMNGVLGMLELLSLTTLDGQQRTTLEVVRESGQSLLRIIDDILDFSKIEAGKLEVRREVASVAKVMASVRGIYSGNASSKGLLLETSVDPRISPAVLVDAMRLQQILNNFVSNAIKFTARGSIRMKAELVGRDGNDDIVRFSVIDTGIGISPEGRERVFQPFAQAGGDIARVYGGTGLGLSICNRLAKLMGGSVAIESEPGKGTTVSVTLPLPVAPADALPPGDALPPAESARVRLEPPPVEEAAAQGRLVLVVDDHPINRLVMSRQVSALGYANETAENGREALERWGNGRYRLVITDVNMPEVDGYQLARAIRAKELAGRGGHTVIIACTANALRGEAENCFAAGMDDYVVKPVELTKLHRKLEQWMPSAAPVDREALAAIAGDNANLQIETVRRFLAASDEDASALIQAIDSHELAAAVQAAHRIKGASATVGALSLAEVADRIEAAARDGDWERVLGEREAFHRELARLSAYLVALANAVAESHAGTISKSRLG